MDIRKRMTAYLAMSLAITGISTISSASEAGDGVSGSMVVAGDSDAKQSEWKPATEEQIRRRYAEHTMFATSISSGSAFAIYYKQDGTYEGRCCEPTWNFPWEGDWSVKGNRQCSTSRTGRSAGATRCVDLLTDGKAVRANLTRPTLSNVRFEKGNKLP